MAGKSGCFGEDLNCFYQHCLAKFRDQNGNPSTITTPRPTVSTESIPSKGYDTPSEGFLANFAVYIGAGCGGFVVFCIVIILCLCRSRNAEKKKRLVIEQDYRVVATTLTNVNDSDGTTYEELCIENPHYNRHENVQLPIKKDRKRLQGVSNTVSEKFKRWVSIDANQATANTSKNLMQAANKPLPPIPEASKSQSLTRYKEVASKQLSQSIDEYTEIGSEVKRRSNVYNPLDLEIIGESRESHGTYETLRASKMLENTRPPMGLPPGEYFTLEKVADETELSSTGEYMVLAKEEDDENITESNKLLHIEKAATGSDDPDVKPYAESSRSFIEDEHDSGICESGGLKHDYYILEKTASLKNRTAESSDYIEPIKGDKHAYMQVLPEYLKNVE